LELSAISFSRSGSLAFNLSTESQLKCEYKNRLFDDAKENNEGELIGLKQLQNKNIRIQKNGQHLAKESEATVIEF
jgi:hypothetical protein